MPRTSVLLLVLCSAAASAAAQQGKIYTVAGNEVAIYNLVGEVTVVGGAGSAVSVAVTPVGKDGGRLEVATGDLRGTATLRVLYPEDEIVYPRMQKGDNTEFTIRDDGTWGGDDSESHRHEGRRVRVRGSGQGLEAAADLRITIPPGRSTAIYLGVGRIDAANVGGELRLNSADADVTARAVHGTLHIDTGSGDIRTDSTEGNLSLDTGSGDVTVIGLASDDSKIDTGSGTVTASGVRSGSLHIDTGSGDIRLDDIAVPSLNLETGSGDVQAGLTAQVDRLSVESGSGDVTVRLAANTGASIDLDTASGDFELGMPVQLVRQSEGHMTGTIGDGRGRIHIETASGDISLKQ